MTASPAPAAMPSEEEIARAMAANDSGPEGSPLFDIHWREFGEGYLSSARAILALFAPILAEKEREIEALKRAHAHELDVAQSHALAAEAALAAERERCAKIAEDYPAHTHGHLNADPHYAAQQAAHEIAAAIRAEGE